MFVTAIVVAAGRGKRLKSKTPKPLIKLGGQPMIIYSLKALSSHPSIKEIIVVANSLSLRQLTAAIKQHKINKVKAVVLGGERRQDSVYNGLKGINSRADLVLIHDAARPFINQAIICAALSRAAGFGAAVAGVPVKATIKKVTKSPSHQVTSKIFVKETVDRQNLWEIQTPQVFKAKLILGAYRKFGRANVTDDAMLVEKAGRKVAVVPGSYNNIKITTPEDLIAAEAIIKNQKVKV